MVRFISEVSLVQFGDCTADFVNCANWQITYNTTTTSIYAFVELGCISKGESLQVFGALCFCRMVVYLVPNQQSYQLLAIFAAVIICWCVVSFYLYLLTVVVVWQVPTCYKHAWQREWRSQMGSFGWDHMMLLASCLTRKSLICLVRVLWVSLSFASNDLWSICPITRLLLCFSWPSCLIRWKCHGCFSILLHFVCCLHT